MEAQEFTSGQTYMRADGDVIELAKVFPLDESIAYVVARSEEHTYRVGLRGSVSFTELRSDYRRVPDSGQYWRPKGWPGCAVRVSSVVDGLVTYRTNAGCGSAYTKPLDEFLAEAEPHRSFS